MLCHYARGVQTMAYSIRPKGGVSNKKLQASPEGLYFQITAQFLALKLIFTTSQSPKNLCSQNVFPPMHYSEHEGGILIGHLFGAIKVKEVCNPLDLLPREDGKPSLVAPLPQHGP